MSVHIQELFILSNKVEIVTGGAGWLGSAVSEGLAQAGATVVIVDKDAGSYITGQNILVDGGWTNC